MTEEEIEKKKNRTDRRLGTEKRKRENKGVEVRKNNKQRKKSI